ncbi:MAG TPA: hypothetical protein VFU82_02560 [Gammaproteobacteria bacterium]|nr:hypothetical protein [Gammaproteobacteria bacterium]
MVIINRSDIQKLLSQHSKDTFGFNKTADVIAKLQAFLNPRASDSADDAIPDVLNQNELYKLALILLTREKSTRLFRNQKQKPTKSEVLAKTLEDKFGDGKFQMLKNHFTQNNGLLTEDDFNRIVQDAVAENDQPNPSAAVQPADVNSSDENSNPSRPSPATEPQELAMVPRTESPDFFNQNRIDDQSTPHLNQATSVSDADRDLFLSLDDSIISRIGGLSPSSVMGLTQTSKRYHSLFAANQELLKKRDLLRQALSHAALGELADVEIISRQHPDLLTCYGTVFHPNRHYVEGQEPEDIPFHRNPGRYKYTEKTVLQILWMNEEYEAAKPIEDQLGPDEWRRQFFEVFPDGVIKKDNFDLEKAKELLQAVLDALSKDDSINANNLDVMNAKTREALDALYAYAKPSNDVTTGLVFDANFYLAALALYETKAYNQFKQQWAKYDFWCIRVEEWLAGCLGTGYFRPHVQGLGNQENRLIGCNLADGTSGFPFRRGCHSVPGADFFVGYYGGQEAAGGGGRRERRRFFENYVKQKTMQRSTYASVQLKP